MTRDIVSMFDFARRDIEEVFRKAEELSDIRRGITTNVAEGKIMVTAFFEPSTRTRLSFTMAMKRLGGDVVDFGEVERTSIAKGETLADTIRVIDGYGVDLIVIRHPNEGAAKFAAEIVNAPVISAGDGSREHPTQALLDLYTMWRELGHIDGLHVGIMGDLKYGRTSSSLSYGLSLFSNVKISYIAPRGLGVREEVIERVKEKVKWGLVEKVGDVIDHLDVLYVTRVQKERLPDPSMYESLEGLYMITPTILRKAKKGIIVMHPLPRLDELSHEVDSMPCAKYFEQAVGGMLIRAALIREILGV